MATARKAAPAIVGLVLCLAVAGCGSSGAGTTATRAPASSATAAVKPPVAPSLRILSPAPGARTGQTVIVRVRLTGAAPPGGSSFRYVLDDVLRRAGAKRLTFHELASGRHRLSVLLAGDPRVRANTSFTVIAPVTRAPAAIAEPTQAPTERAAPPPAASTPAREPAHTNSEGVVAPPSPPSEGTIPQGNGGDHDGDNSGGPSDGDGNV